jgi:hypothetical protein
MSRPSITTLTLAHFALFGHHGAPHAGDHRRSLEAPLETSGVRMASRHILAVEPDASRRELDLGGQGELLHAVRYRRNPPSAAGP